MPGQQYYRKQNNDVEDDIALEVTVSEEGFEVRSREEKQTGQTLL